MSIEGDIQSLFLGIGALVLVVVALDQLVWRPLLAWAERFKLKMVEDQAPLTSWFYDLMSDSRLVRQLGARLSSINERVDSWLTARLRPLGMP